MILVDTSVWIDHLRNGNKLLASLLDDAAVWTHPFVIGELAGGNLTNRAEILTLFGQLPRVDVATDAEVLFYIDEQQLMGRGIGYVDAHLLAACALAGTGKLWTLDKRLAKIAAEV
jgi:predicted nucleic acid-binding protein